MTEYDNNNSGVLFRNDRMREGKKDPEYAGSAEVNGVQYWLKAWINTSRKDGSKFMSLKFDAKEKPAEKPKTEAKPAAASAGADFDDLDDIPF